MNCESSMENDVYMLTKMPQMNSVSFYIDLAHKENYILRLKENPNLSDFFIEKIFSNCFVDNFGIESADVCELLAIDQEHFKKLLEKPYIFNGKSYNYIENVEYIEENGTIKLNYDTFEKLAYSKDLEKSSSVIEVINMFENVREHVI